LFVEREPSVHQSASRFWALAATLLLVNVLGLIWIRASLMANHQPLLRIVSITPEQNLEIDKIVPVVASVKTKLGRGTEE
jgi:hypothetical protein